jgi:hypothetical protein
VKRAAAPGLGFDAAQPAPTRYTEQRIGAANRKADVCVFMLGLGIRAGEAPTMDEASARRFSRESGS